MPPDLDDLTARLEAAKEPDRALCDIAVNRFRLDIDGDRERRKFAHKTAWLKALDEEKDTH